MNPDFAPRISAALTAREGMLDGRYDSVLRLFNGFVEGLPSLVLDLYGRTLVVHDYAESPGGDEALVREAVALVRARLSGIACAVWKVRGSSLPERRNGTLLLGTQGELTRRITENGVRYALSLTMNRDASFYVDTRALRAWAKAELGGGRVLNTFAYTGSLGVAARAGGADVVHTDLSRAFLNVAKDSYVLNGWPVRGADFRRGDFFDVVAQLKRERALFDAVLVDPPFFSATARGRVDLQASVRQLVNKARPLVADGGALVLVNNALFVSGAEYLAALQSLCADGYLAVERFIPVDEDSAGFESTRVGAPPVDPAPFQHSTKIAILRARRKDGRRA